MDYGTYLAPALTPEEQTAILQRTGPGYVIVAFNTGAPQGPGFYLLTQAQNLANIQTEQTRQETADPMLKAARGRFPGKDIQSLATVPPQVVVSFLTGDVTFVWQGGYDFVRFDDWKAAHPEAFTNTASAAVVGAEAIGTPVAPVIPVPTLTPTTDGGAAASEPTGQPQTAAEAARVTGAAAGPLASVLPAPATAAPAPGGTVLIAGRAVPVWALAGAAVAALFIFKRGR